MFTKAANLGSNVHESDVALQVLRPEGLLRARVAEPLKRLALRCNGNPKDFSNLLIALVKV